LRVRLERLVRHATASPRGVQTVEEIVGGTRVRNSRGEFLLVESSLSLDTFHGDVNLSRLRSAEKASLGILSGKEEQDDLSGAVFLDTETTGLSGGSGTAAFLTGTGAVVDDRFVVRQYFMGDYHEEPALFERLAADLEGFRTLVTFNGKIFDLPLLESRFRLNGRAFPLTDAPHLDLLYPARRLWKARLDSCRLQSLEGPVLGFHRVGDIRGEEIPRIYFDYLRSRDGRGVARILEHNRLDIISLAALTAWACSWVRGGLAEDPRDLFSLARVFERAGLKSRSLEEYERVLGRDPVHVPSLLRLGREARRGGDEHGARTHFRKAAEAGDLLALRQLAIIAEHRDRAFAEALALTERGLRLASERGPRRLRLEFERRRRRLLGKVASGGGGSREGRPEASPEDAS
jgi:uncharacterized protein YprB with RNaseH-like and TPR domain